MNSRAVIICIFLTAIYCFLVIQPAEAQQQKPQIRILSPIAGTETSGSQPDIQAIFTGQVDIDSLIIMVDDTDITGAAEITERGVHCQVPMALPSGTHLLYFAGSGENGPFELELSFSSRRSATFEEALSNNVWTVNMTAGNSHSNHDDDFTFTSIDSTLQHDSMIKKGNWQVNITGNARLLEQHNAGQDEGGTAAAYGQNDAYGPQEITTDALAANQESINPERQGLDLNTVLMRTEYQQQNLKASLEVGDLQIVESVNTFESLARNGGQLGFEYHNLYMNGFSVFGTDTFGLHDGVGIGFNENDHLYGFSSGVHLLDNQIDVKGMYLNGGQKENSYSSWSQEQSNSGNVYGLLITTDFFNGRFISAFEYDRSNFDPNTSDDLGRESDEAWRFHVDGRQSIYSYEITYERFGPKYDIPGNLSPKKDFTGMTGVVSMQNDQHELSVLLSAYHDNIDDDPLYARTNSYSGQVDYSYAGFIQFPLGFSYQHTADQSTNEPVDSQETKLSTDTISINTGYTHGDIFVVDFITSYSWQNDDTEQDADIGTLGFTISPSLNLNSTTLSLSGTLNQNRDLLSGNRTDDYILTLDTTGLLLNEQVSYELGGTYDYTRVTDNVSDRSGFTGYSRINYHLPWLIDLVNPTIGLELQYNSDKLEDSPANEDTRVFCTLSASVPFNF